MSFEQKRLFRCSWFEFKLFFEFLDYLESIVNTESTWKEMAPNQRRVSFLPPSAETLNKENSILNDDEKEREMRHAIVVLLIFRRIQRQSLLAARKRSENQSKAELFRFWSMLSHRNRSAKIAAMYDAVMRLSSENVIVRAFFHM